MIDSQTRWPLSGAQSGIWFAQQLDPENPIYNAGEYVEINGPIDPERFESALRQAVRETEALHIRFGEDQDGPWQTICPPSDFSLHFFDVSLEEKPREAAERWMKNDLLQPVDLKKDPLFCQALFKVAPDCFFWYQRIHHIVIQCDGRVIHPRLFPTQVWRDRSSSSCIPTVSAIQVLF